MKTPMQELKKKLQHIKENNCGSFMEMLFFDGVLAIIDAEFLEKEKLLIKKAYCDGELHFISNNIITPEKYYNETFKND